MSKLKKFTNILTANHIIAGLIICFIIFLILSWIIVFRDPRAIIGVGNFYPSIQNELFPIQTKLTTYGLNTIPTLLFGLVSVIAFFLYLFSLRVTISAKKTIIFASLLGSITFLSFPILSTDIFSYIMSERVATTHGDNIWHTKPNAFPDDQFAVLADWKDTTSVYGMLHYFLYLGPSLIGGDNLALLVVLYKIIPSLFAIGSMIVMQMILSHQKIKHSSVILRLLFWNPLVILELFGSGHNDSMMLFFTLLSILFAYRHKWFFSGIAIACAVQIKLIPIVLFGVYALHLIRTKKIDYLSPYITGFSMINALSFAFMQISIVDFLQRVAYNGGVYWQSLPTIVSTFYPVALPAITYIFIAWVLWFITRAFIKKREPINQYTIILLVYLFFVSAAFWNWYVLWILFFLPWITSPRVRSMILLFSLTALLAYPFLWIIYRINTPSDYWSIAQYLFIFIIPVFGYFLFGRYSIIHSKVANYFSLDKLIVEQPKN